MANILQRAGNWLKSLANGRRNPAATPPEYDPMNDPDDDYDMGMDETTYLLSSPANRKHLLESILQLEGKKGEWRLKNLDL